MRTVTTVVYSDREIWEQYQKLSGGERTAFFRSNLSALRRFSSNPQASDEAVTDSEILAKWGKLTGAAKTQYFRDNKPAIFRASRVRERSTLSIPEGRAGGGDQIMQERKAVEKEQQSVSPPKKLEQKSPLPKAAAPSTKTPALKSPAPRDSEPKKSPSGVAEQKGASVQPFWKPGGLFERAGSLIERCKADPVLKAKKLREFSANIGKSKGIFSRAVEKIHQELSKL